MAEQPISLMKELAPAYTCLNESDDHKISHLIKGTGYLESDCDEQLLISLPFNGNVRIQSLLIEGSASRVSLFINKEAFDFGNAESEKPIQTIEFTPDQTIIGSGIQVPLKFVHFQKVHTLVLFIDKNQSDDDTTTVHKLDLFGFPVKVEGTKIDPQNSVSNTRVNAADLGNYN